MHKYVVGSLINLNYFEDYDEEKIINAEYVEAVLNSSLVFN